MTNVEIYKKRIQVLMFSGLSPIGGISPFLIGYLGALTVPNCNESNCGWGVLPWFTFFTFPAAFVLWVIGIIRFAFLLKNPIDKSEPHSLQVKRLRLSFFVWLTATLSPILIPLGFMALPSQSVLQNVAVLGGVGLYAASLLFAIGLALTHGRKS